MMKPSHGRTLSISLILGGCLCIAAPFIIEAFNAPPNPAGDENALPDPSPPDFNVISYDEYISNVIEGGERASLLEIRLPGYDDSAENIAPEETAVPDGVQAAVPSYVLLGSVKIPRIHVSENLFEGTEKQLKHGVGHLEGTPMPGEKGNVVIAAHRVSQSGKQPFRHLDRMQEGDIIAVTLGNETFRYETFDTFIVSQHDLWVLQPSPDEAYVLTLVTCDPVVKVGVERENRLIVRARLVRGDN